MFGVTVVVPNWNRLELTNRLLGQLRAQTYPITEVIVVDNGSKDGSAGAARERGARVIEMGHNAGFTGGVNRGIEETTTDLVAVVNNDIDLEPDWLEHLVGALADPRVWFATGKLLIGSQPGMLDGTFDALCRGGCAWRAGHGSKDGRLWNHRRRINFASFTAAVFRTELFLKVGLLDERFQSYLEDVDFGLRCAKYGYLGAYVPRAIARHQGSATLGKWHKNIVRLMARNQVLLVAKHYPARYLLRYAWPIFVAETLWGLVAAAHGRPLSFLRGKLEGLALFPVVRRDVARSGGWPHGLSRVIEQSESEIYTLQRHMGFDPYWRLYFMLTSLT
jgi:GT2 family glycosyltransferase